MDKQDSGPAEFLVGETVMYTRPVNADEAAARFEVVETRGERVLIRLRCNLPIPPVEAVAVSDVVRVGDNAGGAGR